MNPIWKDYYVTLGNISQSDYSIAYNGNTIFSGTAYRRPDETALRIRINDVCADYLESFMFDPAKQVNLTGGVGTFSVYDGSGYLVEEVEFVNDWCYLEHPIATLATPITGEVDARQVLPFTRYGDENIVATLLFADGTTSQATIPASTAGSHIVTGVFDLSDYSNLKRITIAGIDYKVMDGCNRYALCYINALGGWDTLLVKGLSFKSADIDRKVHTLDYDNRNPQNRGMVNFYNGINERITCNTGYMNDAQSDRIHHLLESVEVYLYDIAEQTFRPVVINDTSFEYKLHAKEGQPVNYTINMTIAQNRTRR